MRTLRFSPTTRCRMPNTATRPMTIGKLAKASQVAIDTVRFYERAGLLPKPQRSTAGYRLYNHDSVRRLRFIRRCKALGFSLDEVSHLLNLTDSDGPSASVRQMTLDKLALIDGKLADLHAMRTALQSLADSCDGEGCIHHCPIVDTLNRDDADTP